MYGISRYPDILFILKYFLLLLSFIGYAGFQSNGINGIFSNFKDLCSAIWELLKFINFTYETITGDGLLTGFFLHYIVYFLVGLLFELFNVQKGCFGKVSYWLIGIPVSIVLNILSSVIFS